MAEATKNYLEGLLDVLNAVYRARGQLGETPRERVEAWLATSRAHEYPLEGSRG